MWVFSSRKPMAKPTKPNSSRSLNCRRTHKVSLCILLEQGFQYTRFSRFFNYPTGTRCWYPTGTGFSGFPVPHWNRVFRFPSTLLEQGFQVSQYSSGTGFSGFPVPYWNRVFRFPSTPVEQGFQVSQYHTGTWFGVSQHPTGTRL